MLHNATCFTCSTNTSPARHDIVKHNDIRHNMLTKDSKLKADNYSRNNGFLKSVSSNVIFAGRRKLSNLENVIG